MFQEDLSIFTDGEFSQVAIVNGVELSGIFDEYYEEGFDLANSQPTEGRKYCFKVNTLEVVGLNHGALVTTDGRDFEVVNIRPCRPDGKLTDLILKEVGT